MRVRFLPLIAVCCAVSALTQAAQPAPAPSPTVQAPTANAVTAPKAGKWSVTARTQGLPMGNQNKTREVCLAEETLNAGFESAFFEAVPPDTRRAPKGGAPTCRYGDLRRDASKSTWIARCSGPFGEMAAQGSAVFDAERFDGQQKASIRSPMGTMNTVRLINAVRIGDCTPKKSN